MAKSAPTVLPPRYRVLRKLGEGGSAEILLVEDRGGEPKRKALKILRADPAPEAADWFRAEFRTLAALEHPALARVHDLGRLSDGRLFYTTDFVDGRTLDRIGEPPPAEACRILGVVCRALSYVHARGFVHNDIKPANVIVSADGGVRLLDFGLSALDRRSSPAVAGTPGYIAPERLAGRPWDRRADIYSVGATLFRLLCGRRVVEEEDPERALAALTAAPPPHRTLRPELPLRLCEVLDRLLATEPARRPPRAEDVIRLLGDAVGESLPLETPGTARCYALASTVVGRDRELADIEALLDTSGREPRARLVAVSGEPGMGKSRLLREAAFRAASAGWRVATISCRPGDLPAGVFGELSVRLGLSESAARGAVAFAAAVNDRAARPADAGPVVVAVDAAHHAPDALWQAAFVLAGRGDGRKAVVVLLAFDAAALSPTASKFLSLAAPARLLRIDLGPLPPASVRRLLDSLFGEAVVPASEVDRIARSSGGRPLLVEEAVSELVEGAAVISTPEGWRFRAVRRRSPPSARIEDYVRRQLARLPRDGANAAAALAVLGGASTWEALVAVLGPAVDAAAGMAALADRGLAAEPQGGEVALSSTAMAASILDALPPDRRRAWFRSAALWLREHGADAAACARAFAGAGEPAEAFRHALAAGRAAVEHGEATAAIRWLEEALASGNGDLAERRDALILLARACDVAGKWPEALGHCRRALDLEGDSPDGIRAAVALLAARVALRATENGQASVEQADPWIDLLASAAAPGDAMAAAKLARIRGVRAVCAMSLDEARDCYRSAAELLAPVAGSEAANLRAGILSNDLFVAARFDEREACALAKEAAALAAEPCDRHLRWVLAANVGSTELWVGQLRAAEETLTRVAEECEEAGDLLVLGVCLSNLVVAKAALGDWVGASAVIERARVATVSTWPWMSNVDTMEAHFFRNEAAQAESEATEAARIPRHFEVGAVRWLILTAVAALRGDRAAAARAVAELEKSAAAAPLDAACVRAARGYARAVEDPAQGAAEVRRGAETLWAIGHSVRALPLLRDAARLLGRGGDVAGARACLERARELAASMGSPPQAARLDDVALEIEMPIAAAEPAGWLPRMLAATSAAGIAAELPAAARAFGAGSAALLGMDGGGAVRELAGPHPEHDEPRHEPPEDLRDAVSSCLRLGRASRSGGWILIPAPSGARVVLAVHGADGRTASLLGEVVFAALSRMPPPGSAAVGDAAAPADRSAHDLELTLGPVRVVRGFEGVVGRSQALQRAVALVGRLADADISVLITGPTGTGKEVFARALHAAGRRGQGPFVPVNCAAVPAALFEAELFGYRRGAFSGALRDHAGVIEQAGGGTLFLDEVGELAPSSQAKLLRVLERRGVRRLGEARERPVDFRLVAATARELGAEVGAGRFRADLYYRVCGAEISLPALRDRLEDLPELAAALLARDGSSARLGATAVRLLARHDWPGNVRELENELRRARVLAGDGLIRTRHLSPKVRRAEPGTVTLRRAGTLGERVAGYEREVIRQALREAGGSQVRAARALGITRQGLRLALLRLGLSQPGSAGARPRLRRGRKRP